MSALPTPEIPPPQSSDKHGASPRVGTVHEPCRKPAGPPRSATARLYLVDPAADTDEIVTSAVSLITTTDTAPGDRILLADPATTPTTSRTRRERLVESVLRLGRGASTTPRAACRRSRVVRGMSESDRQPEVRVRTPTQRADQTGRKPDRSPT